MIKISAIVPVYKVKEVYLRKCIESVLNQTMSELELIIVADGAPDYCLSICKEYAWKDERVNIIYQQNQGVSVARNIGISKARGEYSIFLDADDWIELDICEKAYEYAKSQSAQVLIFAYDQVRGKRRIPFWIGESRKKYSMDEIQRMKLGILRYAEDMKSLNITTVWGKLYQTGFLLENKLAFIQGLKRGEDMIFNLYALDQVYRVASLDIIGYHYRLNDQSESQAYTPEIVSLSKEILGYIKGYIQKTNKNQDFVSGYYAYTLSALYEQMYMYYFNSQNRALLHERIRGFLYVVRSKPYCLASGQVKLKNLSPRLRILAICYRLHGMRILCYAYILNRKWKENKKLKI